MKHIMTLMTAFIAAGMFMQAADMAPEGKTAAAFWTDAKTITIQPKATDEALINPGMGFVFYRYAGRLWAYGARTPAEDTLDWFPGVSTMYMRILWSDLEPTEGEIRWDLFDSFAQNWIAKGKKIAIRIICCNQTENACPDWLRAAGAKGHWFRYKNHVVSKDFPERWEPVYDDPVFLEKFTHFLKAFAARYDGDPSVAFIDIGSFGLYGEGHLAGTFPVTPAEKKRLAKLHIDLWKKYLPNTYLVISDDIDGAWNRDPDGPLMKYCRDLGIGFRDDSIFCFPTKAQNPKCPFDNWAHDNWARLFAPKLPVVVETGHYTGCNLEGHWNEARYLECVEAYQASYLSIHDFPDEHLKRCRPAIDAITKRLGYRFILREASFPSEITPDEPVTISSTWMNAGVAWNCKGAALSWALLNADGTVAWSVTDPSFDFKTLNPTLKGIESPVTVTTRCRFGHTKKNPNPDNCLDWARQTGRDPGKYIVQLKPGAYTLAVSVGSRQGTPEIALPLENGRGRRYPLGKITLKP